MSSTDNSNATMESSDEIEKEIISTVNDEKREISTDEVTTSLSTATIKDSSITTTTTTNVQNSPNNNDDDQITTIIDNKSSSNNNNKEEYENNDTNNNNEENEGVFYYSGKESLKDEEKKNITKVIVEDGVEIIPEECFRDCKLLEKVQLPSSLISIKEYAFFDCEKLNEIIIPEGVRIIARGTFYECTSLVEVALPTTITTIEASAFYSCKSLKEISLPNNINKIEEGAFRYCASLRQIKIPPSVETIPENCFKDCERLEKVQLPSSLLSIEKDAFRKCEKLKAIIIPEGVRIIGDAAFFMCTSLVEVTLPTTITTIEAHAFRGCRSLEQITLTNNINKIGEYAFGRCSSLQQIIIPSSVDSIEKGTFEDCVLLKKVVLPQRLESIGEKGFKKCWKLEDINITNRIKSIDSSAFDGCVNLPYDTINWPSPMKEEINNNISNNPWLPSKLKALRENIVIKEGPGPEFHFGGKTQRGWGPEWWAISRQQLEHFKTHPAYYVLTMRQFVTLVLEKITDGLGIGYALLINQKMPLKARIMISHAWDEPLYEFVENILASGEEGPFWICSTGIYQNNDAAKGVTISEQIGPSPEHGPFATVLQVVDRMLAVITTQCNIYTRLWCVYELFIASKFDVPVTLRPFIAEWRLRSGFLENDVCIANIGERINSETARCGNPNNPPNADEIAIRNTIEVSEKKFRSVDEAVELIRLIYLLHYPTEKIVGGVTSARDTLKDAIETVLSRLPLLRDQIMKFDQFIQQQLSIHPGFHLGKEEDFEEDRCWENHHCIVSDTSPNNKIDVFDGWCKHMIEIIKGDTK